MRLAILAVLASVGLVLCDASAPRAQEPIDPFQVQGWAGAAYLNPRGGTFRHCVVSSSYSGVALSFVLGPTYDFRIEIGADDWRLKPGGEYVATLMIDHREPLQIIASARSDKMIAAEFGPDEDIVKELRDGQFLRVLAEHIGISFSLSGSSQALLRLRSCVNEHRGPTSATR
jgi:hypothetical protein